MPTPIPSEKFPALIEACAADGYPVSAITSARIEDDGSILCLANTKTDRLAIKLDRDNITAVPLSKLPSSEGAGGG